MTAINEIETAISFGDSHFNYHIDHHPMLDYAVTLRPSYINIMGDVMDLDMISHHEKENFKNIGFDKIKVLFNDLILNFKGFLGMIRATFPKAKINLVPGNHEEWLCGFANEYPQLDEKWDRTSSQRTLENLLETEKIRVNVIPFGQALNIGKLYFRHGHEYGTSFPAKQAVMHSHKSIAIWHHHTRQVYTTYSDIGSDEYCGFAVPCMCTKAMKYGKGKPNRWTNGFLWSTHKKSGNFTAEIITTSKKGHFLTIDGREFC